MLDKLRRGGRWDLTALLNAADPKASMPERHLWLIRLLEWLRRSGPLEAADGESSPPAALRLRHLLNVLDRHPAHREHVVALLGQFWREVDVAALLADFGFAPRTAFASELGERLRNRLLPGTPATTDLAELFGLLFSDPADADWLLALDETTLERLGSLFDAANTAGGGAGGPLGWREPFYEAVMFLASQVRAAGFSSALRQRMSASTLSPQPFRQLARTAEGLRSLAEAGDTPGLLREMQYLRALLEACRQAAASVHDHLEEHGVSVGIVFQLDQLQARTHRIEELLNCAISPAPGHEIAHLLAGLVRTAAERRSVRALLARNFSMLARKLAERSAETGEHYITRDRSEYRAMLRKALGGGAIIGITTFLKFLVVAAGFSAFWSGWWAGINYAASFVLIHLLHWTVATKQPAMTAPAMAAKLDDIAGAGALEGFVDEVAHLIRSQVAGILGNLAAVFPLVLAAQGLSWLAFGRPLVSAQDAGHALHALTLLGPTAVYAAFTGVLLFVASLIAGWVENAFVLNKLDSAIRWNPRIVAALGHARAERWSRWWRANISGLSSNISLGLMLGLVPAVLGFFALPLEVRHITLSTGQLAAALGTLGPELLRHTEFWWCAAALPVTGLLNLGVSFWLAFRLALRSRGIRVNDRARIYAAIRARLRHRPLSFLLPPREAAAAAAAS
ncbi:MAG TPA: site-specific recombinase [Methylibium sp.]